MAASYTLQLDTERADVVDGRLEVSIGGQTAVTKICPRRSLWPLMRAPGAGGVDCPLLAVTVATERR